ncbi:restriction endonuclease subunit S [Pseudomonas sp. AL 58]|jgi:type I restriction enzyme S subunit|uniref:restriction endonuclease subunit S n=1 Tax=Pseudomonas sp. AL 58 TaxID=3104275 RepID=UPI002ECB520C|nr:restriction endonuclease subunit S [Pseudomonas sp. AL 58]
MSYYKPYPAYKDSGVEWLGKVPEHWQLRRLKHMARFSGGGTPARDNPEFWNGDIPWVSPKDMKSEFITGAEECITAAGLSGSTSSMVPAERVLMVVRSGILKHTIPVAINSVPVALNQDMKAIWLDADYLSSPFFMRWVQGLNDDLLKAWLKQGATVESIEQDYLSDTLMPVPSVSEREQIVRYLDRETARIDALIEKKTRFIELLREKRQALITHAVTKGLDPNVKMNDSGVEWLGEVPEHWEVRSVSSVSTKITNGYVGPTRDILVEEGVRYLQSLHIKGNQIKFDVPYFVTEAWSYQHRKSILETGDVLIVQTGDIGQVTVVTDEFAGCNCHALIIVAPERSIIAGEWMSWVFNSSYGYHTLLSIQTGAMHPHLNCGNVKDVLLPVPPLSEQREIMQRIEHEERRVAALAGKTERSIELLKERRSALITAAVTGQIDLREAV